MKIFIYYISMKKSWKFIIITLLIILGLFGVGVLYLFFVPGSSLFNITYINKRTTVNSKSYDATEITTLEINSNIYDVNIVSGTSDKISASIKSTSFGFVTKANSVLGINETYDENLNKLTFTSIEPSGFCTKGDSQITIYVPSNKSFDLIMNNKKSDATLNLAKSSTNSIGSLKYSSTSGSLSLENTTVYGPMDLNLNRSSFSISKTSDCSNAIVKIKATSGKFNAPETFFKEVIVEQCSKGKINIGSCSELKINCPSDGGSINVAESVLNVHATIGDASMEIAEISGEATIDIRKSASVKIKNLSNENTVSTLTQAKGTISIEECHSSITAYLQSGSLNINKAHKVIFVDSQNANVNINFDEEAAAYTIENNSRVLYGNIKNGSLTATGVEHIGKYEENKKDNTFISITGSAEVNINMSNVLGENIINAQDGKIKIVVDSADTIKFVLKTQCKNGSVRVNLSQTTEFNGYTTTELKETYVNCLISNNVLSIIGENSKIEVYDKNFA